METMSSEAEKLSEILKKLPPEVLARIIKKREKVSKYRTETIIVKHVYSCTICKHVHVKEVEVKWVSMDPAPSRVIGITRRGCEKCRELLIFKSKEELIEIILDKKRGEV